MRLLARREYSVFELQTKLKQKQFPAAVIHNALAYLRDNNYQSDSRCAVMLLRHGINSFWGPNKIRMYIAQKGISHDLTDSIMLNTENTEDNWYELAATVARRKFGENFTIKNNFINEVKLKKFLYNRGFESEHISYVIKYFLNLTN